MKALLAIPLFFLMLSLSSCGGNDYRVDLGDNLEFVKVNSGSYCINYLDGGTATVIINGSELLVAKVGSGLYVEFLAISNGEKSKRAWVKIMPNIEGIKRFKVVTFESREDMNSSFSAEPAIAANTQLKLIRPNRLTKATDIVIKPEGR